MRSICARSPSSATVEGSGTTPVTGTTAPGVVPQVTIGAMSSACIVTDLS